jgi:GntR family transcriptional repressor for pyruvate dehydrogenase complex
MVDGNAADRTLAEHEAIYQALAIGDAALAQAAALVHVSTTEKWLRKYLVETDHSQLDEGPAEPDEQAE